jgi:hypothetical protein
VVAELIGERPDDHGPASHDGRVERTFQDVNEAQAGNACRLNCKIELYGIGDRRQTPRQTPEEPDGDRRSGLTVTVLVTLETPDEAVIVGPEIGVHLSGMGREQRVRARVDDLERPVAGRMQLAKQRQRHPRRSGGRQRVGEPLIIRRLGR